MCVYNKTGCFRFFKRPQKQGWKEPRIKFSQLEFRWKTNFAEYKQQNCWCWNVYNRKWHHTQQQILVHWPGQWDGHVITCKSRLPHFLPHFIRPLWHFVKYVHFDVSPGVKWVDRSRRHHTRHKETRQCAKQVRYLSDSMKELFFIVIRLNKRWSA